MKKNRRIELTIVKPLTDDEFRVKYADRVRRGKTAKDHRNGAPKRNADNKAARAEWQRDPKTPFPRDTCNGKRNRYIKTAKKAG